MTAPSTTTTDSERLARRHPAVRARRAALGAAAVGSAAIFAVFPLTASGTSSPTSTTTPTTTPPTSAQPVAVATVSPPVTSAYQEYERDDEHDNSSGDDGYRAAVTDASTTAAPTAAAATGAEATAPVETAAPVTTTSGS